MSLTKPNFVVTRDINGRFVTIDGDDVLDQFLKMGAKPYGLSPQQVLEMKRVTEELGYKWDATRTRLLPPAGSDTAQASSQTSQPTSKNTE